MLCYIYSSYYDTGLCILVNKPASMQGYVNVTSKFTLNNYTSFWKRHYLNFQSCGSIEMFHWFQHLYYHSPGIGLEDFVHPSSWTVISARENMTNVTTVTCVLHDPSNRSRRIITQWFQRNSIGEQRKLLPDNPLVLFHGDPQPNNNLFTTYRNLLTIVSFGPEFHNSTLECGFNTDPISSYPLLVFSKNTPTHIIHTSTVHLLHVHVHTSKLTSTLYSIHVHTYKYMKYNTCTYIQVHTVHLYVHETHSHRYRQLSQIFIQITCFGQPVTQPQRTK